jgi:hypothetical protein
MSSGSIRRVAAVRLDSHGGEACSEEWLTEELEVAMAEQRPRRASSGGRARRGAAARGLDRGWTAEAVRCSSWAPHRWREAASLGMKRISEGRWQLCPVEDAGIAECLDGSCGATTTALSIG